MAKKSKIAKDAQRRRIVARYAERRADLKRRSVDVSLPDAEREAAIAALHALPRDASPVRLRNRDAIDGRPRGHLRRWEAHGRVRARPRPGEGTASFAMDSGARTSAWRAWWRRRSCPTAAPTSP